MECRFESYYCHNFKKHTIMKNFIATIIGIISLIFSVITFGLVPINFTLALVLSALVLGAVAIFYKDGE